MESGFLYWVYVLLGFFFSPLAFLLIPLNGLFDWVLSWFGEEQV
jgi:hypothetical protein